MCAHRPTAALSAAHPVIIWIRSELLPRLVEQFSPTRVVVFDPPDHAARVGDFAPGLLIVSTRFEGVPMPERLEVLRRLLSASGPVRPLCLTPEEFLLAGSVPGPVLAAARTGLQILPQ